MGFFISQPARTTRLPLLVGALLLLPAVAVGAASGTARSGAQLYRAACSHCHGVDGRGVSAERLTLPVPLPDFTDCQFAPREPDSDWLAVIHEGGPARAFDRTMPAFGDALSDGKFSGRSTTSAPSVPRRPGRGAS
jgi:hypothetical protein